MVTGSPGGPNWECLFPLPLWGRFLLENGGPQTVRARALRETSAAAQQPQSRAALQQGQEGYLHHPDQPAQNASQYLDRTQFPAGYLQD